MRSKVTPIAIAFALVAAWYFTMSQVSYIGDQKEQAKEKTQKQTKDDQKPEVKKVHKPKSHVIKQEQKPLILCLPEEKKDDVIAYLSDEPKKEIIYEQKTAYVRIDYGYKSRYGAVGRISFSDNFAEIKSLKLGIDSSLDTDGQIYIGIHLQKDF